MAGLIRVMSHDHFQTHGWIRIRGAFGAAEAAAMREAVWRALAEAGDPAARIERFHARVEEVDGIPLQVLENTAAAGDVILMHPLLLHAPSTAHLGSTPRFLFEQGHPPVTPVECTSLTRAS